jgi:hypothetical protein
VVSAAVVVAASTAALASTQRPQWRDLAALVLARCASLLVVAALCLSVVGIPLAVRQWLRWAFLEQVVLLDGCSTRRAFAASAAVVNGHAGWTLAAFSLIWAMTLLGPSMLGIGLLVTVKSLPLAYVHVLATAVQAGCLPFAAIASTLVYFDLQLRRRPGIAKG